MKTNHLIIEAGQTEKNYWADLWRYRDLFYILSWRDIKVRYKQTVVGVLWSVLRPLLTMIIFTFVFSNIAKLPAEGSAPYAIMVYAAMLPWQFFSNALSEASNSLVGNANLISKVYFPRLIIPTASVITSFVDFLISFVILVGLMIYYMYAPSWNILLLPVFLVIAFLASMGLGLLPYCTQCQVPRLLGISCRFWYSSACISLRSASAAVSYPKSGACSIRSTRW
ncbi:hypothetical protein MASR1M65_18280 [Saprospiraceae bacterium]